MSLNLERLISSESNYDRYIGETMTIIKKDTNIEATLRKIILFCKYAFSVNYSQQKKLLCLMVPFGLSSSSEIYLNPCGRLSSKRFWMKTYQSNY